MITLPRWFLVGVSTAAALYASVLACTQIVAGRADLPAFVLFAVAFLVCVTGRDRMPAPAAALAVVAGLVVPAAALLHVVPAEQGPPLGSWSVPAVGALAVLLLFRGRGALAWSVLAVAAVQTYLWGGVVGLARYGVFAELLIVALITAGALAMRAAERELSRSAAVEREGIRLWAAQEAYHGERETRLRTMAALSESMLQRIADRRGALDPADRLECRLLHSTIRDETRGKRLLNDAVRAQVLALRRRGATVQVNDDGGLDETDAASLELLLDRVAAALVDLPSDLVVLRTAPADSATAITVVGTSSDPVAAALGLDDGDDRVDLWLELERPTVRPSAATAGAAGAAR